MIKEDGNREARVDRSFRKHLAESEFPEWEEHDAFVAEIQYGEHLDLSTRWKNRIENVIIGLFVALFTTMVGYSLNFAGIV